MISLLFDRFSSFLTQEGLGSAAKWKEKMFQQSADRLRHNVNLMARGPCAALVLDSGSCAPALPRRQIMRLNNSLRTESSLSLPRCQDAVYGDDADAEDEDDDDGSDNEDDLFKRADNARGRSAHGPDALVSARTGRGNTLCDRSCAPSLCCVCVCAEV